MTRKNPKPSVFVGLRYDDFSSQSSLDLEKKIIERCAKHGAPCTFGVIPNVIASPVKDAENAGLLSDEKKELLRDGIAQGIIEVALHGLTHTSLGGKSKSEFHGLPRETQYQLLAQGKSMLEEAVGPVHTFIPPWNSYDRNTLAALKANGFKVLSAASNGLPDDEGGLDMIPATCLIENLRMAVEKAIQLSANNPECQPLVIGYFHPYDFKEVNPQRGRFTLEEFENILRWLSTKHEVEIRTIRNLSRLRKFSAQDYARFSFLARFLPSAWERFLRPIFWAYPYPSIRIPFLGWLWAFGIPRR